MLLRLLLLTLAAFLGSLFASPEAGAFGWKTAPGDEVRQHGDAYSSAEGKYAKHVGSTHENAGPEAERKAEERWVPSGNRAEQIFLGTLEDAGENGPSAREQCRVNGWLNYDTASGCAVAARNISNPIPDTMARVIPGKGPYPTLGPPGRTDVFITAADDIAGLTPAQISQRLTIPASDTFTIIRFPTPSSGVASPILRPDPGFIGGGRTLGGAREFVIPNGPIPPGATTTVIGP